MRGSGRTTVADEPFAIAQFAVVAVDDDLMELATAMLDLDS